MLLHLANFLAQFQTAFQVFNYLTLRVILAALTALMLCLWLGPWVIRRLVEGQIGQAVRDDGPQSHLSKAGTPTMGGAMILLAIAISTLLWGDLTNYYVWIVLLVRFLGAVLKSLQKIDPIISSQKVVLMRLILSSLCVPCRVRSIST